MSDFPFDKLVFVVVAVAVALAVVCVAAGAFLAWLLMR